MDYESSTSEWEFKNSRSRVLVYIKLLEQLRDALNPLATDGSPYDYIRAVRDEVTHWAPWTISLPIWERIYSALSPEQQQERPASKADPVESIRAQVEHLREVLQEAISRRGPAPELDRDLLGALSTDVDRIRQVA